MAGSKRLVREPNVWELRAYVGRDPSGKVRHRHWRFVGTKRAADRALADLVAEVERERRAGEVQGTSWSKKTFDDAFSAWKENGWQDLSPSTTRRYESMWEVHVAGTLGPKRIADVGPYELERYFRQLKASGLAEASVRQIRAVLNRTCRLARRWSGGVLSNPVAETELPSWSMEEESPVRAPETGEVAALLRAAESEDVRVAVFLRVLTATGARRGEICALRWEDLDEGRSAVTIDESVVAAKGGAIVKGPKTRASVRTLAVDSGTLERLRVLRFEQERLARLCEVDLPETAFVFSFEPGGSVPPHPDAMSHAFSSIRSRAGVAADVHLHSLRHFQATVIDSVVSERQKQARLGWATAHMARHYTDPVTEEDQKAATYVGRILDGGLPQVGQRPG